MARKNTGGSAFPAAPYDSKDLTVRDYFAAAALPGIMQFLTHPNIDNDYAKITARCYEMADAMIAGRTEDK